MHNRPVQGTWRGHGVMLHEKGLQGHVKVKGQRHRSCFTFFFTSPFDTILIQYWNSLWQHPLSKPVVLQLEWGFT